MAKQTSFGKICQENLLQLLNRVRRTAIVGPNAITPIDGVTHDGKLLGLTMDQFLTIAGKILFDRKCLYNWNDDIVFEFEATSGKKLELLAAGIKVMPEAANVLSGLMVVQTGHGDSSIQSTVPTKLVRTLLTSRHLRSQLRVLRSYSRRPIYEADFRLCGPGWDETSGTLCHGGEIVPALPKTTPSASQAALDRLPPFLRKLLCDFCFATDADLTNAVAMLLTGFLANLFVEDGKPLALIDANQKGVGKTILVDVFGHLLDGIAPQRLRLTNDDDLEKRIGAQLRGSESSLLFFDNVRGRVDSPFLEANLTSPAVTVRLLGHSAIITRPNMYLWCLTANGTQSTEDLLGRSLPIRLRHEGDPRQRNFSLDPRKFAAEHRFEILGELAGLVEAWKLAGKPLATLKHRFRHWAETVGGILQVAGLDQFLQNVDEAEAEMDEGLQALVALAEYVVGKNQEKFFTREPGTRNKDLGGSGKEWLQVFTQAGVFNNEIESRPGRGRDTFIGHFLSGKVKRSVQITTPQEGCVTATLEKIEGRGRKKQYFFVVAEEQAASPSTSECCKVEECPVEEIPVPATTLMKTRDGQQLAPDGSSSTTEVPSASLPEPEPADGNHLTWF